MSWETPQACKICGTAMRNIGIGFRALWHCDRCEDRFSAVENRTASEDTKPLFEDWFKDLAVGDRFSLGGNSYKVTGVSITHIRCLRENDNVNIGEIVREGLEKLITPIPRDASRAALAVQDTSGSSKLQRIQQLNEMICKEQDALGVREVHMLDPGFDAPRPRTPQPPESALPGTSDMPSPLTDEELEDIRYCSQVLDQLGYEGLAGYLEDILDKLK